MNQKLLFLTLPLFLLIFVSSASAETATSSSGASVDNTVKLKAEMMLLQDHKKTTVSQIGEETKAMIQVKRDEFKAKLRTIKDQRKELLVEKIDAKLAEVNKNQTTRFTEVVTRLQAVLDKVKSTATDPKTLTDIATAQTSVDAAKSAVETQAGKVYTMTITDDSTLKLNAGTTISAFRLDLMAIYKLVIDAKQAVQKLNTDKTLMKKEATSSAKL